MLPSTKYSIAIQFSRFPGGRRRIHGKHSGEEFREDVARKLLSEYQEIEFDLTGSAGYSSGFLDEAFGGLLAYYSLDELKRRVKITAQDDPDAVETAWRRMSEASQENLKH